MSSRDFEAFAEPGDEGQQAFQFGEFASDDEASGRCAHAALPLCASFSATEDRIVRILSNPLIRKTFRTSGLKPQSAKASRVRAKRLGSDQEHAQPVARHVIDAREVDHQPAHARPRDACRDGLRRSWPPTYPSGRTGIRTSVSPRVLVVEGEAHARLQTTDRQPGQLAKRAPGGAKPQTPIKTELRSSERQTDNRAMGRVPAKVKHRQKRGDPHIRSKARSRSVLPKSAA